MTLYWSGLRDYLQRLNYEDLKEKLNIPDVYCPMAAYSYKNKTIAVDENQMNEIFNNRIQFFQLSGIDEFECFLSSNSELLQALLHEIDHSIQYKKAPENNGSIESSLLLLCYYPEIEILGRSELKRKLYLNLPLVNNTELGSMYKDIIKKINKSFFLDVPYERLAQIDSIKQVLGLLEVFNTYIKIPKVLDYFRILLLNNYMQGYDKTDDKKAPTIRYIMEIEQLEYSKLNKLIKNLQNRFNDVTSIEEKAKYGLSITNDEALELKKSILR